MRPKISHFSIVTLFFFSCKSNPTVETIPVEQLDTIAPVLEDSTLVDSVLFENTTSTYILDTLEQRLIDASLIDIQSLIPSIKIDLRYSSTNNFMERDVYGHLNRVYLQPSVAKDLIKCQNALKEIDSSLTLLVYDGVRPRSVQQIMWDVLDIPIHEKTKFVSNPKNGSIHNYGAAVDLTIADFLGNPIDMGAGYDDIRKIAYPRHEKAYLDSGLLSLDQIENRKLLRKVMKAGGFWNIQTEWWHFNRYNRDKAKSLFEIVE